MNRIASGVLTALAVGLIVALLREFGWDPFLAAEWIISWVWEVVSRIADLWSSNETFKEVTKKPA